MAKELAFYHDRYNLFLNNYIPVIKLYEQNVVSEYTSSENLLYNNSEMEKLVGH